MNWLRLLVRVFLAATVLLALAVVILLGPLRGWSTDIARRRAEQALAAVLNTPVAVGALRISLVPPQVEADAIALGPDGALAHAAHVTVRLRPRTSLRQLRPVADAVVDDVFVDVPRWVDLLDTPDEPGPPGKVPAFRLRTVRISGARVRAGGGEAPLDIDAGTVAGELGADALGHLHFAVDAELVALTRRDATLTLANVRGRGGETLRGWRLSTVEAVGDGVQLTSGETVGDRLPIRGRIALRRLAFASPVFERLDGDAEVDAALIGPLDEPAAAGSVRVADFTADGERVGDVRATAEWNLRELTVTTARLEDGDGAAEISGELAMSSPFAYHARLRWTALDLHQLAHLPSQAIKSFAADGEAGLSGTLEPLVVRAEGGGRFVAAQGGTPIEWRGQGSYRDGGGAGEIDATQGRANTVRARLEVGLHRTLSGSLDAAVADPTALGAFLPIENMPNLSGALTASAQVTGTTDDPRLTGELAGRDVVLLGVGFERLSGPFALDRAALHTPGITATLWQGSIALTGTFALDASGDNDWQLQVVNVPGDTVVALVFGATGLVPPIGRGTLAAHVSGQGPWPRVQITGSAAMENFWLSRQWIVRAELGMNAVWPRWQLSGELRNSAGQTLTLRSSGTGTDDVVVDAHSSAWELTALQRGELSETGGTLMLDASLAGPLSALSGRAALQARELVAGGRRLGTADLEAIATRGRWQMTATLLGGAVLLRGRLAADAGWPFSVDGEWTGADFGSLLAPDTELHVTSSGTAQATMRLTALDQFDASVRVQSLQVANGPYELSIAQPAVLECRRGACTLHDVELRGTNTELRATGTLSAGGVVRLRVNGQGDLRLLEVAGGAVTLARGSFTIDAKVQRVGGRWDVSGEMRFERAGIDVGAPVAITRATGRLTMAGTMIRVDQLTGRMGTGTFAVSGAVDLARGPDLSWTLTDVGADPLPSLEAELSGRGSLEGTWDHMQLSGTIEIARMLYDRNIELTDFLPSLNRALAGAPRQAPARRVDLDLHIVAPGELYVENNIARVEARADLRISGTADRPVLAGRIEALDGTVTFRDRVFELHGGTVDFRPDLGLTAALNITAESTIDTPDATYTVDVRVTGTTADPRVTMTSDDPSLSPTDVAALVAVGKTTAQLREGGGGFSVYDALAAVPGQFSGTLEKGTKQILPIDRISFESTYSRTSGTFEPQLKLGKDLTDNLAVSVGQTFGVSSRTSVAADYRLTQRVFIPLTWESQTSTQEGAFGAGVKVRYDFWRVTPYTLLRWLR